MTTEAQRIQDIGSWIEDGDFKFINEGSIVLVQPMNDDAAQWLTQTSNAVSYTHLTLPTILLV